MGGLSAIVKAGTQGEGLQEAKLLKSLRLDLGGATATLPALLSAFRDEAAIFWVFSGRAVCTLQQLSAHSRLEEAALLFVVACVVSALEALHGQCVLLRGVASSLLMVNDVGYVTVVDMRQSRVLEGEASFSLAGQPQYLAPEQIRGEGHAFPVDWWALGVLSYELACQCMPFEAGT